MVWQTSRLQRVWRLCDPVVFFVSGCLRRRLATANRSRISIRINKNFGQAGGGIDPGIIFITSSLITMQNFVALYHAACMHVGYPKNLGMLGPRPLGMGCGWPQETRSFPTCYHTKFGRSSSNPVGMGWALKFFGMLGHRPLKMEAAANQQRQSTEERKYQIPWTCSRPAHLGSCILVLTTEGSGYRWSSDKNRAY